jgi:two-component sensor histidine kinase
MKNEHGVEAELAGVVVHQLRNRLSRVLFGADALLAAAQESAEVRSLATRLRRGIDELTGWLDQLIELAQVLNGRAALRLEEVDLRQLVYSAIEQAQPVLTARRHTIELEGFSTPLPVLADRLSIQLVIGNLLSNAAKFTPPDGHLGLRAHASQETVHLHVRDDGVGIAPERIPSLFELKRADAGAEGGSRNIQAGLFLVRRLLELHGGTIELVSSPGQGTEAIATVPRVAAAEEVGRMPRALIVSDTGGGALAAVLRSRGYRVDLVPDAPAALALAEQTRWDVVLVDAAAALRDAWLPARLRGASVGATLLLVGAGPRTLALADAYDGSLAVGFDEDLLHAAVAGERG